MKRKILLGLTGSVASVLYEKLVKELQSLGDVEVILTEKSEHFVADDFLKGVKVFREIHEWTWHHPHGASSMNALTDKWKKDDPILHINLRDSASALVIAPCSANTLAKLANGLSDNLLTSVARAWDLNRPVIIAPAMNTHMWNHPITQEHITKLQEWRYVVVPPQSKMLACKTEGMGAMANIEDIVNVVDESLQWFFPLGNGNNPCSGIPSEGHPGAFLTKRKHHTHTGVDLYTYDGAAVYAVENGVVVGMEHFTGPKDNTPWWNDTDCLLIEGASGVVCYGEISPFHREIGDKIVRGEHLGYVKRVLKEGKERPDIEGHSTSMLHLEMYKHGIYRAFQEQGENLSDWNDLIDPTPYLMDADGAPKRLLK